MGCRYGLFLSIIPEDSLFPKHPWELDLPKWARRSWMKLALGRNDFAFTPWPHLSRRARVGDCSGAKGRYGWRNTGPRSDFQPIVAGGHLHLP